MKVKVPQQASGEWRDRAQRQVCHSWRVRGKAWRHSWRVARKCSTASAPQLASSAWKGLKSRRLSCPLPLIRSGELRVGGRRNGQDRRGRPGRSPGCRAQVFKVKAKLDHISFKRWHRGFGSPGCRLLSTFQHAPPNHDTASGGVVSARGSGVAL